MDVDGLEKKNHIPMTTCDFPENGADKKTWLYVSNVGACNISSLLISGFPWLRNIFM